MTMSTMHWNQNFTPLNACQSYSALFIMNTKDFWSWLLLNDDTKCLQHYMRFFNEWHTQRMISVEFCQNQHPSRWERVLSFVHRLLIQAPCSSVIAWRRLCILESIFRGCVPSTTNAALVCVSIRTCPFQVRGTKAMLNNIGVMNIKVRMIMFWKPKHDVFEFGSMDTIWVW